jgi:hypothetical protein
MNTNKKRKITRIQIFTFLILGLVIALMIYLDSQGIFILKPTFAFVFLGIFLLDSGLFGLLRNDFSLGNPAYEYDEKLKLGKTLNIIILISGIVVTILGTISTVLSP